MSGIHKAMSTTMHCKALLKRLKSKESKCHGSFHQADSTHWQCTQSGKRMDKQKGTVFMEYQKVRKRKKQLMKQLRLCTQGSLKSKGKPKGTKKRKEYMFWHQTNEKPTIILGSPGIKGAAQGSKGTVKKADKQKRKRRPHSSSDSSL